MGHGSGDGEQGEHRLAEVRRSALRHVIGANRGDLRRFEQQIVERTDWQRIREDVEVNLCPTHDGEETYILCRSEARRAKDAAIVARAADRIRARLDSLQRRLSSARKPAARDQVNQQIGRILARNSRAARCFKVSLRDDPSRASGLGVVVCESGEWVEQSAGCYLLRSNVSGWTNDELWRT